jgi:hypothetical protein
MSNFPINQPSRLVTPGLQAALSQLQPLNQVAATPVYGADQFGTTQQKDPAVLQAVGHYAQQLQSTNPVDVTMALSALDGLGPVYRQEVNGAVMQAMRSGVDPITLQELSDYLIRNQVAGAAQKLQMLSQDVNPQMRAIASSAYAKLVTPPVTQAAQAPGSVGPELASSPIGAQAVMPGSVPQTGAAGAVKPGIQPTAPGVANGTPGAAPAASTPEVEAFMARLREFSSSVQAESELPKMSTAQLLAVAQTAHGDGRIRPQSLEAIIAALNQRIKEPGVMDFMRAVVASDGYHVSGTAKARAAVALTCFGTKDDLPAIQKFLAARAGLMVLHKEVVLECLVKRRDFLEDPATVALLKALLYDRNTSTVGLVAMRILGALKTPKARDIIGEAPILTSGSYHAQERIEALKILAGFPKPYSEATLAKLKVVAGDGDPAIAKEAKALLGQGGGGGWFSWWPFGKKA